MKLNDLNILADENIPALEPLFGRFGSITRLPGRNMQAADLADADLLLVRSITQVNEALLEQSPVRFVGTATIGTDHIDQDYLQQRGIAFSSAPGCNADAVAEYVISTLLLVAREQAFNLQTKTVGIVGVGNVGSRLQHRLERLGIRLLLNDPPRQKRGEAGFSELNQLLAEADIICLHTPLTREGEDATRHLLNKINLPLIKQGAILLNAGRGPVIDNQDLLEWHQQREDVTLLLDVWEDEPRVDAELAARVRIGTPHIAGYSYDGKIRGTWMLYQAFCESQGITADISFTELLPGDIAPQLSLKGDETLTDIVHQIYQPEADDQRFRDSLMDTAMQPQNFDLLRKQYPVRREFAAAILTGASPGSELKQQLEAVGFILP